MRVYSIVSRPVRGGGVEDVRTIEVHNEQQLIQAQADIAEFMADDFVRAQEDE